MIYGYLHQGSGIGNQLHRYVATRVVAKRLHTDWRMIYNPDDSGKKWGFKADDFLTFDYDKMVPAAYDVPRFMEKKVTENGIDIRSFDPEFDFIEDNTVIDGEFQDERYWQDEDDVDAWLHAKPINAPGDLCVIGFRGGEFSLYPDLFLPMDYYREAMDMMLRERRNMHFEVHTDDEALARKMFPTFPVIANQSQNWRSMRYVRYAIIANSSFFIFPRWLNDGLTIAPRYWGRHNLGVWSLPQNYYSKFTYI